MKRSRHLSTSDESDHGSNSTCWSQHSQAASRRSVGQKPSEVFRTDLITAMKIHDSQQMSMEDFFILADPWRQEWEKGVQVPVSPQSLPEPGVRIVADKCKETMYTKPKKLIRTSGSEALGYVDIRTLAEGMCRYDLNEVDEAWLHIINQKFTDMGLSLLDEITMERVMEEFERQCHNNMNHAMETEEGLGIEYDEDVVCEVCHSPDGEDNNEMVFCDKCNICVHQACYGIQKVPKGSWLCRICALGILPKCQLCPKRGGAMKPTRSGTKWVHVSCALWIPEVSIGNPEKMEPIMNVSHIPSNRWALICCLCKEKTGACIQCSAKNCRTAFHVTCGLHANLEMNTFLTEEDEVKFKSYCPKHSGLEGAVARDSSGDDDEEEEEEEGVVDKKGKRKGRVRGGEEDTPRPRGAPPANQEVLSSRQQQQQQEEEKRVNLRKMKLQELEEDFFQFVEVAEVAEQLKLSPELVDFVFQYWKLKRKANFNQPLLTPKKDEEESLARREHEVLLRRLQLFTHLRQDLERVRNLTYMVTRREKLKRSLCRVQEQVFQHQVRLLDQQLLTDDPSAKDLEKIFLPHGSGSRPSSSSSTSAMKSGRLSLKPDKRISNHRRSPSDSALRGPATPAPTAPAPTAPAQTAPTQTAPVKTAPAQTVPAQTAPAKTAPAQTAPAKMVPAQTAPAKTAPAQTAPVQTAPAKLAPTQHSEPHPGNPGSQRPQAVQETSRVSRAESRRGPRQDTPGPGPEEGPKGDGGKDVPAPGRKREGELEERKRKRRGVAEESPAFPLQTKNRLVVRRLDKMVFVRLVDIRMADPTRRFSEPGATRRSQPPVDAKPNLTNGPLDPSTLAKPTVWLRRADAVSPSATMSAGGHLKNWGKFRIPKRGEREQQEPEPAPPLLQTPASTTSYPRTRLRAGAESGAPSPEVTAPGDPEAEPCLKRCHSHQLRRDASLGRRYGGDIIRRGVLAS